MKRLLSFMLALTISLSLAAAPKHCGLHSPDGRMEVRISVGEGISYDVVHDGVNAHRITSDYRKVTMPVPASRKITVKMAPGGGWTAEITMEH